MAGGICIFILADPHVATVPHNLKSFKLLFAFLYILDDYCTFRILFPRYIPIPLFWTILHY